MCDLAFGVCSAKCALIALVFTPRVDCGGLHIMTGYGGNSLSLVSGFWDWDWEKKNEWLDEVSWTGYKTCMVVYMCVRVSSVSVVSACMG